jgi:ribose 5-phosphate isomerase B
MVYCNGNNEVTMSYSVKVMSIGSDHAGFAYKEKIKLFLIDKGVKVLDFGCDSGDSCDYPDHCGPAAQAVADGEAECGIVLGGSGNGEAIVANKVKGIRCGVCWNISTAALTKQHNNANMISIGERQVSAEMAFEIVDAWLSATFEGGRHQGRIDKIE